ncbi:MAG: hypothetical protein M3O55_10425, partial [Actinomycetota bacterium]|nr:hypothetical protein [Actinomycetota bacterium]
MSQAAAGTDSAPTAIERLIGGALVALATLLVVLVECFLVGLRVGNVHVPVSIAIAAVLHPLLTVLMGAATRSKAAMLAPLVIWVLVVWPLAAKRAEGDLIITGNNWSLGLLAVGSLSFAITLGPRLGAPSG